MGVFLATLDGEGPLPADLREAHDVTVPVDDLCGRLGALGAAYSDLIPFLETNPVRIALFTGTAIEDQVVVPADGSVLYVKEFYYYTLVGRARDEFHAWTCLFQMLRAGTLGDLALDLHRDAPGFLALRRDHFSAEEYECLAYGAAGVTRLHAMAMQATLRIFCGTDRGPCSMERKIIRDNVGHRQARRMLGLDDDAFRYLEERVDAAPPDELRAVVALRDELDRRKLDFAAWTAEHLAGRRLLFWSWWTISPFVSADLGILIPLIVDQKTIRKVVLDLPFDSQNTLNSWYQGRASEAEVEEEIRKVYPPDLARHHKETLPYLVLLNKLRDFRIPVECAGFSGADLLEREPLLNHENRLSYPADPLWKRKIAEIWSAIQRDEAEDLTIFFHFLKPMFPVPVSLQDPRVERILHADKLTGYGPKKPENLLSRFSRRAPSNLKSFVLPDLRASLLADDPIVYFPFQDDPHLPRLDDSRFNRFGLYDTLIYSSHSGGGGGWGELVTDPPVDRLARIP